MAVCGTLEGNVKRIQIVEFGCKRIHPLTSDPTSGQPLIQKPSYIQMEMESCTILLDG
jgi:hypothetical protein